MGTGVSLDVPAAKDEAIFEEVFKLLRKIDERFSSYKKNSELARYQRGEVGLSEEMATIKKACTKFERLTDGYFSAYFSGKFDPTGYVKGWAIAEAGKLLDKKGIKTFCMSIGGDILARSDGNKEWKIGIQDPTDSKKILNKLSIFSGAVATSGNYERGQHIINPKTGRPADELLSVTVVGPDIITADALATACFAMGNNSIEFLNQQKNYEAVIVTRLGKLLKTDSLDLN